MMNHFDWVRFDALSAKMEAARDAVGRPYTSTADLTSSEKLEWDALNADLDRQAQEFQAREEREYRNSQLAAMLGEEQTTVVPYSDAA